MLKDKVFDVSKKNRGIEMENECNACGSSNVYGMSRVVGYYSIIENWNGSKQAELKDRQKGDYKLAESKFLEEEQTLCQGTSMEEQQSVVFVE